MAQPGRPDKPDAFWWNVDQDLLANFGVDPTLKGAILSVLQPYILRFIAEARTKETWSSEEVIALLRDYIYGWPKPGKS